MPERMYFPESFNKNSGSEQGATTAKKLIFNIYTISQQRKKAKIICIILTFSTLKAKDIVVEIVE